MVVREEEIKNLKTQLNYHKNLLDNYYKEINSIKFDNSKVSTYLRIKEESETIVNLSFTMTYLLFNKE